jgi:cobalt-zinc-cadmium efflux system protein
MAHNHNHKNPNYNRAFAAAILLNVVFVIIEAGYGIWGGSLALLADAGHNLSDVLSLLLAWGAGWLAARGPSPARTYGFRRATILAPVVSSVLLLAAMGGIGWEAIRRFYNSQPAEGEIIIFVAGVGVVINSLSALLFFSGQKQDLNIKAAFLHLAADAGVSLGVVAIGAAILMTGWFWLDPLISLAIIIVILAGTWGLLRDSINLSLDAVPRGIDMPGIQDYLTGLRSGTKIHDLHVWPLSVTETALTVHLVVPGDPADLDLMPAIQRTLHDQFGIEHATIQIEREPAEQCCPLDRPNCLPGCDHGSSPEG